MEDGDDGSNLGDKYDDVSEYSVEFVGTDDERYEFDEVTVHTGDDILSVAFSDEDVFGPTNTSSSIAGSETPAIEGRTYRPSSPERQTNNNSTDDRGNDNKSSNNRPNAVISSADVTSPSVTTKKEMAEPKRLVIPAAFSKQEQSDRLPPLSPTSRRFKVPKKSQPTATKSKSEMATTEEQSLPQPAVAKPLHESEPPLPSPPPPPPLPPENEITSPPNPQQQQQEETKPATTSLSNSEIEKSAGDAHYDSNNRINTVGHGHENSNQSDGTNDYENSNRHTISNHRTLRASLQGYAQAATARPASQQQQQQQQQQSQVGHHQNHNLQQQTQHYKSVVWARMISERLNNMGIYNTADMMREIRHNPCLDFHQNVGSATLHCIQKYADALSSVESKVASSTKQSTHTDKSSPTTGNIRGLDVPVNDEFWTNEDQLLPVLQSFESYYLQRKQHQTMEFSLKVNLENNEKPEQTLGPRQRLPDPPASSQVSSSSSSTDSVSGQERLSWSMQMLKFFLAHGWKTPYDVHLELQKANSMESILKSMATSRTKQETTLGKSPFESACEISALQIFLSRIRNNMYDSQMFETLLIDFATVHSYSDSKSGMVSLYSSSLPPTVTPATNTENMTASNSNIQKSERSTTATNKEFASLVSMWAHQFSKHLKTQQPGSINSVADLVGAIQNQVVVTPTNKPKIQEQQLHNQPSILDEIDPLLQTQLLHYFCPLSDSITRLLASNHLGGRFGSDDPRSYQVVMLAMASPEQAHQILLLDPPRHSSTVSEATNSWNTYTWTYEQRQLFYARPLESRLFLNCTITDLHDEALGPCWLRTRFSDDHCSNDLDLQKYNQLMYHVSTRKLKSESTDDMGDSGSSTDFAMRNHRRLAAVDAAFSQIMLGFFSLLEPTSVSSPAGPYTTSAISLSYLSSQYYSEACILASAMSNSCRNIHFGLAVSDTYGSNDNSEQAHETVYAHQRELQRIFGRLMKVAFRNIAIQRFLSHNYNSYRLVHCMSSYNKFPLLYIPVTAFFIQSMLLAYIFWEVVLIVWDTWPSYPSISYELLALASVTSTYSLMEVVHGMRSIGAIQNFYDHNGCFGLCCTHWIGLLALVDVCATIFLPLITSVVGFVVVAVQSSLLDGILIAAVLLVIPHVDGQLPKLLNLSPQAIIQMHLLRKAVEEVNMILTLHDEQDNDGDCGRCCCDSFFQRRVYEKLDADHVEFHDILVTNTPCEGSNPLKLSSTSHSFGPHEVVARCTTWSLIQGKGLRTDRASMTQNLITEDCLLKEVKWRYKRDHRLVKGLVDHLVLVRLDGKELEFSYSDDSPYLDWGTFTRGIEDNDDEALLSNGKHTNFGISDDPPTWDGHVEGIFIVTTFEIKHSITKLRLCGSKSRSTKHKDLAVAKANFKRAIEYYSLWELDSSAKKRLN